ncbi:MAG TPA: hypothetical protein VEL07_15540 [Planctomycetota bacterium]|nr:hypothetical protein [Planctomycetota bacterium]
MIDDGSVFVGIDAAAGYVRNLSTRLRAGIVFEIGPSIAPAGRSYPAFFISDVDTEGNVLDRAYITKSSGQWEVEDC